MAWAGTNLAFGFWPAKKFPSNGVELVNIAMFM